MIRLAEVSKTFNRGEVNEVEALRGIDLEIAPGSFTVLLGSNGSGKTTLLNVISGAILPSAGNIYIRSNEVTDLPEHRRSRWIARVFQDPLGGTAPDLSILDNFRLAALRTAAKTLRIGINDAFRKKVQDTIAELGLGLENKLQQPMGSLSGGQRQALTLLMSVMDHTDILLLDEPTAALDPKSADVVLRTAEKIIGKFQLTTIMITHNLGESLRFGNRLIQMDQGRIIRDLNASEKEKVRLEDLYQWFQ
ncbi:ABC transporter ATP-binding protein [Flavilitoribacter nigricans DSM 23189 = NBRC 102662]|uniref:ABC transporter ATP-binding protein n=2 Tax=Flavilitoribacter TaxID=2762562 RepID=A0A2D0N4Y5_FLAN2|nr:ABC transporter ATP-binding protein [Flavilitoribacter nigricans DSM 23189 = NBRC 102662]